MSSFERFKAYLRANHPRAVAVSRDLRLFPGRFKSIRAVFTDIYHSNGFEGDESVSGAGSSLRATVPIRQELPSLVRELGVRSILDASCGDFHWMKEVDFGGEVRYMGADIVAELIDRNQLAYGNPSRTFVVLDITRDPLPKVDLVLCRDCLIHFSDKHTKAAIRNFKLSGSRYLLTTTFPGRPSNRNMITGIGWRPLNLQAPPFNFPEPSRMLNERCLLPNGEDAHKFLGLWILSEIS
jgi:SAM-dependent methyltransferase